MFDEIWELSDPPHRQQGSYKTQKRSKDIIKMVHVASVV